MSKDQVLALRGKRVMLRSDQTGYVGTIADARDREGGAEEEFWIDFEDGYSIPSSVSGLTIEEMS